MPPDAINRSAVRVLGARYRSQSIALRWCAAPPWPHHAGARTRV